MIYCINEYEFYGSKMFDIVYVKEGYISRVVTRSEDELPKTAREYLSKATPTPRYCPVFNRDEIRWKVS